MGSFLPDAASGASRDWHPLIDCGGNELVVREVARSISWSGPNGDELPRDEIVMRLGELRSLIGAAERGELAAEDWKPVVRHPELWELRWSWGSAPDLGGESLWRGYFHEPTERPSQTVLAHVHRKDVASGDRRAIRGAQNASLQVAADRVTAGRACVWGLDHSGKVFPEQ